ncbi:MAG TPA: lysylphosphatidylglycerol synthase transmembrane domain-containing protein [Chryseolinea sp.]|nr:lysylphosphatidylglycerol synthase transmembrane domain-containing protein [Chryseolinea sp.]
MTKKILGLLQYIFFLGLGLFLLWLTLRKSDWNSILNDLSGANYIYLLPATITLMLSHYIRALRWQILIHPLGYRPGIRNTFMAVMVGYWANLAVPRLGEVLKCTILSRYEKVPAEKLVGTIVAERAIDVCSLIVVMLIAIVTQYDLIGNFASKSFESFFDTQTGRFSVEKLLLLILIIALIIFGVILLFNRLGHLGFVVKTKAILSGIWQGLISIRYIQNKGLFLLHSALIWSMYLVSTYMGFFAMHDMRQYGLPGALSALTFGSFGMIIPSPGGIGSFQYAIQQVMILYGASPEKGLSLGMLIWFAQTGIIIIFGTIAFLLLPILNKNKPTLEESKPQMNR